MPHISNYPDSNFDIVNLFWLSLRMKGVEWGYLAEVNPQLFSVATGPVMREHATQGRIVGGGVIFKDSEGTLQVSPIEDDTTIPQTIWETSFRNRCESKLLANDWDRGAYLTVRVEVEIENRAARYRPSVRIGPQYLTQSATQETTQETPATPPTPAPRNHAGNIPDIDL